MYVLAVVTMGSPNAPGSPTGSTSVTTSSTPETFAAPLTGATSTRTDQDQSNERERRLLTNQHAPRDASRNLAGAALHGVVSSVSSMSVGTTDRYVEPDPAVGELGGQGGVFDGAYRRASAGPVAARRGPRGSRWDRRSPAWGAPTSPGSRAIAAARTKGRHVLILVHRGRAVAEHVPEIDRKVAAQSVGDGFPEGRGRRRPVAEHDRRAGPHVLARPVIPWRAGRPSAASSSPWPPDPPAADAATSAGTYPNTDPGKTPGTAPSTPPTEPVSAPPTEDPRPGPPDHPPPTPGPDRRPAVESRTTGRQKPRVHHNNRPPEDQLILRK